MGTQIDRDLPLMADIEDVQVKQYSLNLTCSFEKQLLEGYCILVTDVNKHDIEISVLTIILDCHDIDIQQIEGGIMSKIELSAAEVDVFAHSDTMRNYKWCPLDFVVDEWSVRIMQKNVCVPSNFKNVIKITYKTRPCGASLMWAEDQNGNAAVYTPASWINNRSLFPAQDVPLATACWQANITVPSENTVLMSANTYSSTFHSDGTVIYHFDMAEEVPPSTVAIAIGQWQWADIVTDQQASTTNGYQVPCRLYAVGDILPTAEALLTAYVPKVLEAMAKILGRHPYPRTDILVMPCSFPSLGLTSPNLVFLSHCLLCKTGSMLVHVAHELSHSWFGLAIGAKNWSEEWLSEGFATFLEDWLHIEALKMLDGDVYLGLRMINRYLHLKNETTNTPSDLQILSSDVKEVSRNNQDQPLKYVENGLCVEKAFTEVHYLKGYFFLQHICNTIGVSSFREFLKHYITTFKRQQISSNDVFKMLFEKHGTTLRSANMFPDTLRDNWMTAPGIPKPIEDMVSAEQEKNAYYLAAINESKAWTCLDESKKLPKRYKRKRSNMDKKAEDSILLKLSKFVHAEQLVLVLEKILEEKTIHHSTLARLYDAYSISSQNSEVQHRWCELVVKHKYVKHYSDVKSFLLNNQAMGVYLYGELMLSRCRKQQQIARNCFMEIKSTMEETAYRTVFSMLYGKDPGYKNIEDI